MPALAIMLVRHAEKPGGDFPGPGLDAEGAEDDKSLVVRGWQRAGAWAALLGSALATDDYLFQTSSTRRLPRMYRKTPITVGVRSRPRPDGGPLAY